MAPRKRPFLAATRVTGREKGWIEAVAQGEGVTVSELLHRIVVPEIQRRLAQDLTQEPAAHEPLAR